MSWSYEQGVYDFVWTILWISKALNITYLVQGVFRWKRKTENEKHFAEKFLCANSGIFYVRLNAPLSRVHMGV